MSLVAVQNSNSGAPLIIQSGKAVMSLGGFSGSDPMASLSDVQSMIKDNTVRYFCGVGGGYGRGGDRGVGDWVASTRTVVPASSYTSSTAGSQATSSGAPGAGWGGFGGGGQQLYDCAGVRTQGDLPKGWFAGSLKEWPAPRGAR